MERKKFELEIYSTLYFKALVSYNIIIGDTVTKVLMRLFRGKYIYQITLKILHNLIQNFVNLSVFFIHIEQSLLCYLFNIGICYAAAEFASKYFKTSQNKFSLMLISNRNFKRYDTSNVYNE